MAHIFYRQNKDKTKQTMQQLYFEATKNDVGNTHSNQE